MSLIRSNKKPSNVQYSLKSILVMVLICSVPLGILQLRQKIWNERRKILEPSLVRYIISQEFSRVEHDNSDKIYLVVGHPSDLDWSVPSKSYIERIGLECVRSGKERDKESSIFYVGSMQWIDAQTVVVDHGICRNGGSGHGFEQAEFRLVGGRWTSVSSGTEWMSIESNLR